MRVILQADETLSQFQHFDRVRHDPWVSDSAWCMFCDDDDFSHPSRVSAYRRAMQGRAESDVSIYIAKLVIETDQAAPCDVHVVGLNMQPLRYAGLAFTK